MFHVTSSLLGGFAAVAAWALVTPSFAPANPARHRETVNRVAKGDRLAPSSPRRQEERTIATVEVVGVHDTAIVYRDRDGNVLFQTDPLNNVTIVSKGFVLPQLTVREAPNSKPAPVVVPRELEVTPVMPIGCEPVASPIVEPQLAHTLGRCISRLDTRGPAQG